MMRERAVARIEYVEQAITLLHINIILTKASNISSILWNIFPCRALKSMTRKVQKAVTCCQRQQKKIFFKSKFSIISNFNKRANQSIWKFVFPEVVKTCRKFYFKILIASAWLSHFVFFFLRACDKVVEFWGISTT